MGISSLVGAGLSGAASIFGASQSAKASKQAAAMQYQAAMASLQQQREMFDKTQANIAPFLEIGKQGATALGNRLTELTSDVPLPANMTQAELEATPGYQFTLSQGLKATQGSAAARGLGLSGAAMKGAAAYATGLSDQTYNTRFNQAQQTWQNQVTNKTNNFNRLLGTASLGTSAATGQNSITQGFSNGISNSLMQAGNAQANGVLGAANAWNNGINGLANAANSGLSGYNQFALMQGLGSQKNIDFSQYGAGNKLMDFFKGMYGG